MTKSLAQQLFARALAVNANLSDRHNSLGSILFELGDAAGALRHYRAAVAAGPESAMAHLNLGLTLVRRNELAEALPFLEGRPPRAGFARCSPRAGPGSGGARAGGSGPPASAPGRGSSDPKVRKAAADLLR